MYNLDFTQHNQYRIPKPDRSVLINSKHPLAQNVAFYTNFAGCSSTPGSQASMVYEQISRTNTFPISTTLVTTSGRQDLGTALSFTGGATSRIEFPVGVAPCKCPALRQVTTVFNPLTVGAKFRATAGADGEICSINGATGTWYLRNSGATDAGKLALITLDTTKTLSNIAINTGAWFTGFGIIIPGSAQRVFVFDQFGVLLDVGASSVPTDYSTGTGAPFIIGAATLGAAPLTGDIEWVGVWAQRILSIPEMQALAGNPYQIFNAPAFKRRWLDTTVPVVGTTFVPRIGGPSGVAGMCLAGGGGGLAG